MPFDFPTPSRNPRVGCRGRIIPNMDLRAWRETAGRTPVMNAPISTTPAAAAASDSVEDSAGDASPSMPMPLPSPEDDWVVELPRPITVGARRAYRVDDNSLFH